MCLFGIVMADPDEARYFRLLCKFKNLFSYFSTKTYVVGIQKNLLMRRLFDQPKQMFKLVDKKITALLCLRTYATKYFPY